MTGLIKRLREQAELQPNRVEASACVETEAADRIAAMKAAGDGLGPFAGHQLECRMGMRLGRQYCTCGLTAALKQWKEASDV